MYKESDIIVPLECKMVRATPAEIVAETIEGNPKTCAQAVELINIVTMDEHPDVEPIPITIVYPRGNGYAKDHYFLVVPKMHREDIPKYLDELKSEDILDAVYRALKEDDYIYHEFVYDRSKWGLSGPSKQLYDKISDAITNAYMFATTRELK